MFIFLETITFEHDLSTKSNFSAPRIYTAKGDISKSWYVYFSFRDPITKKLVRMKNVYGKANNYKTKTGRLTILTSYRKNLLKLLKEGYSPFEKNKELKKSTSKNTSYVKIKEEILPKPEIETSLTNKAQDIGMPLNEVFEYVMKLMQNQVKSRTLQDYRLKTKSFLNWLSENYPSFKLIYHSIYNIFKLRTKYTSRDVVAN